VVYKIDIAQGTVSQAMLIGAVRSGCAAPDSDGMYKLN